MPDVKEKSKSKQDEKDRQVIEDFRSKKGRYQDYWSPIYKECQEHFDFTMLGKQIKDEDWSKMGIINPKQPNLLITYANHEANKTLQTDYRIKVSPNGSGASDVAARERQEVLRGQQRVNNITQIFNQIRRQQVAGGISYSLAIVDYASRRGYGKTLKDEYLEDWKNVFPDINVKTVTFSDARDFLIRKMVPRNQWEEETGEKPDDWGNTKEKELWYYWVREDIQDIEYSLKDGKTALGSKLDLDEKKPDYSGSNIQVDENGEPLSRNTEDYTWCWYKITQDEEIVDEEEWKGSYCPLVACTGRKVMDDKGKIHYQPLTQFAEEPQQIYTILENIIALRLSRSPFSKFMVALESVNIKDMETIRKAAMLGASDILYSAIDKEGNPIPAPQEIQPYVLDPLLISLQQEQDRKIQKIFGIFDANLGNRSNEQSGVAIAERAKGGELSNYDSQFNYMEYVQQVGRVKMDLIPKYLTATQQLAFVDENDNAVLKWVNATGGAQFSPDEEYALSVEAMPISTTAREDEAQTLIDMAKVLPQLAQNNQVAALIVKSLPGRYSQQISEMMVQGDPQLNEAKAMIQQLQQKISEQEQGMKLMQGQVMQDQIMITGLKQTIANMKQQMAIVKQMQTLQGQTDEMQDAYKQLTEMGDKTIEALELQVKQYDAETKRITADANAAKAMGIGIMPVTPELGQPLT
jgi:hypothetical protein